ncbi:MAG TPA: RNA polymerase sigma factor [Verrucomicrobiae bacterium]|nr:RNA polymerase sigma factor [Verrucomicrobiae bacterium]
MFRQSLVTSVATNFESSKDLFPVSRRGGNIPVEAMLQPDNSLIAEFNARRSEDAFAALVRQHVNLVFATALRQVGDVGAAEEITQNVFVALAQAAGKLGTHPTIAGWLHQTTLNQSRAWLRSELRRRKREQVAVDMGLARTEGDSVWSPLVPLLDEALLKLREPDRQAVILHYMEGCTFQEVGSTLGVGEDAARKRVNRCLQQLTEFFSRQGFAVPAHAAGGPLFVLAAHAAPAGLAASATTAGLAAVHSAASASTLTLIEGALKIMAWTKAKSAIVAVAAVIVATGTTTVVIKSAVFGSSHSRDSQAQLNRSPKIYSNGINNAHRIPNPLYTYPDGDETTHRYVINMVKEFRKELDPAQVVKSDRELTEQDIQTRTIYIYGSPENHSLFQRVRDQLPIVFESDGVMVGDKKCLGRDVGAIFTCPNPVNPKNRLIIYGTVSPEALRNMNAVFHGPTDYVVFNNTTRQHSAKLGHETEDDFLLLGSFDKSDPEHWRVDDDLQLRPAKELQRATAGVVVAD